MSEEVVYRRGDVLWRRTYDRMLILVPSTGQFITLQGTGRDVWAALEDPASVGELAARLAATYVAPVGRIASDITPVVEELERYGALVVTDRHR